MKPDTPVLYAQTGPIGRITLNRPDRLNTITRDMLPAFQEILCRIRADRDLRCLIITGSGEAFCGGADLKNGFEKNPDTPLGEFLMDFYRPFLDIGTLKVPVIAAINGHAVGGGFGIAILCDIRVASRKAKLGANFARLGIHSGLAISYILPRLVGLAKATELLFTGRVVTGEEALGMGLVNYATDPEKVLEKAVELAEEISRNAPLAVQLMKQSIYEGLDWNPVKAADMESRKQAHTFETEDAEEGIRALFEKRAPVFKGASGFSNPA